MLYYVYIYAYRIAYMQVHKNGARRAALPLWCGAVHSRSRGKRIRRVPEGLIPFLRSRPYSSKYRNTFWISLSQNLHSWPRPSISWNSTSSPFACTACLNTQ